MELNDLRKLGLTSGEVKIYSALLELGETTRTELAKKSGVSPSKIYDVANRLLEKGIISIVKKNGAAHFSAANPERLKDFVELKETEIKREKEVVEQMLPLLLSKYTLTKEGTDIDVFYGWGGMKTVFSDKLLALSKKDINLVFGASQGKNPEQADTFFSQYFKKVEQKGFKVKIIFNEEVRQNKERIHYYKNSKRHEVRFLHQETFTEIDVYKDTVMFIMLLSKPIIIRVKNKEAADSFRKYFDTLWKQAKE